MAHIGNPNFDARSPQFSLSNSIFLVADIDFSVTSFDDLGDWKIGNDCSGAENSGPCTDVSSAAKPCMFISL